MRTYRLKKHEEPLREHPKRDTLATLFNAFARRAK
jgi:hypothetical protein